MCNVVLCLLIPAEKNNSHITITALITLGLMKVWPVFKSCQKPRSTNAMNSNVFILEQCTMQIMTTERITKGSNTECLSHVSLNSACFCQLAQAGTHHWCTTKVSFSQTDCQYSWMSDRSSSDHTTGRPLLWQTIIDNVINIAGIFPMTVRPFIG